MDNYNFPSATLQDLSIGDRIEVPAPKIPKTFRLRFTLKQFETFKNACRIFDVVSQDPRFVNLVSEILDARIDRQTVNRQLISPIVDAPEKAKAVTRNSNQTSDFIKEVPLKNKSRKLIERIKTIMDVSTLRCGIHSNVTCSSDIRKMLLAYIAHQNLTTENGDVIVDEFLYSIAGKTLKDFHDTIFRTSEMLIPKADKQKIISKMANEIRDK